MTLGELIEFLDKQDQALVLPEGFENPHSYRGYYDELAFEPAAGVTVASMLDAARFALGHTFHGWKGGEYVMADYTDCWLAVEGSTGEGLGPQVLRLMIAAGRREDAATASAPVIVYVSIGNSDDKLTQAEWSAFVARLGAEVATYAVVIHGAWFSLPHTRYQNACWCLQFADHIAMADAREALTAARRDFRQDSAAWAVARTEFL